MSERRGREGQSLGNYRLMRLLDNGGFAEVYLGEHVYLNTQAAIQGRAMTPEQVLAAHAPRATPGERVPVVPTRLPASPTPSYPAGLSAREVEVLRLVAQGPSNAQSADLQRSRERLVLAQEEERRRLARELHDSISLALYGISLGVHTAQMQLVRDPKQLAETLDYVLELTEAALIEMRALIFELRPESLGTEGLVTALTKQAAALHARQCTVVRLELGMEPDLPLKVKQDLYRIAQEALHNTVKHAHASQVLLRLEQSNNEVIMEVHDDGRGFDTTASFPGHLGLSSMRERVANLDGTLQIESTEGHGTTICIRIPGQGAFQR